MSNRGAVSDRGTVSDWGAMSWVARSDRDTRRLDEVCELCEADFIVTIGVDPPYDTAYFVF
jgi:hypothetical protein